MHSGMMKTRSGSAVYSWCRSKSARSSTRSRDIAVRSAERYDGSRMPNLKPQPMQTQQARASRREGAKRS